MTFLFRSKESAGKEAVSDAVQCQLLMLLFEARRIAYEIDPPLDLNLKQFKRE
jgi:hypothetical protein